MAMMLSRSGGLMDPFDVWGQFGRMLQLGDQSTPHSAFAEDARAISGTRLDWVETPNAHEIKVELPGVAKEDIKVQVEDNSVLSIAGERKKETVREEDTWHAVERIHGKFLRRLKLPPNAQVDGITAKVENGVLCVEIPKANRETKETKQINLAA